MKPSLFRRKRRHARAAGLWDAAGTGAAAGTFGACTTASIELDTGIGADIAQIAQKFGNEADQREDVKGPKDDRIVAADDAFVTEKAQAIEGEKGFDQERS